MSLDPTIERYITILDTRGRRPSDTQPSGTAEALRDYLREDLGRLFARSDELRALQTELTEALRDHFPRKDMPLLSKYLFAIAAMRESANVL